MKKYDKHVHIEAYQIEEKEYVVLLMDNDTHALIPGDEFEDIFNKYSGLKDNEILIKCQMEKSE